MPLLGMFVSIVYRALFMQGDEGFKRVHWIVKILHTAFIVFLIVAGSTEHLLLLLLESLTLTLWLHGVELTLSLAILSSAVSAYLALTTLIVGAIGLVKIDAVSLAIIMVRTFSLAVAFSTIFIMVSPLEIVSLLITMNAESYASIPMLIWRLMPQSLKMFLDSIQIGYVKGERTVQRIPPAVAGVVESGRFLEENCLHKLYAKPRYTVLPQYSKKYSVVVLLGDIAILLLSLFPTW